MGHQSAYRPRVGRPSSGRRRTVTIYVPSENLWGQLVWIAAAEDRSVSYVAVMFLRQGIEAWQAAHPERGSEMPDAPKRVDGSHVWVEGLFPPGQTARNQKGEIHD